MKRLVPVLFAVAAVINLIPWVGVVSATQLESLYSIPISDPNLEIVMRHRAVSIGLVGATLAVAVFRPGLRTVAALLGLTSMGAYALVVGLVGEPNAALTRVLHVDLVGLTALAAGFGLDRRLAP